MDFEERGNLGLEQSLDTTLRGRAGTVRMLTDVQQRGVGGDAGLSGYLRRATQAAISMSTMPMASTGWICSPSKAMPSRTETMGEMKA